MIGSRRTVGVGGVGTRYVHQLPTPGLVIRTRWWQRMRAALGKVALLRRKEPTLLKSIIRDAAGLHAGPSDEFRRLRVPVKVATSGNGGYEN